MEVQESQILGNELPFVASQAPTYRNREFPVRFTLPDGSEKPQALNDDLGRMLLDIQYEEGNSGRGTPVFFDAKLENGVLEIPRMPKREEDKS